ncbi:MAG: urease accessory protein UreE [Rhizomicrobium sp.]
MRRATKILPAGSWQKSVGVVKLAFDDRYRRRITLTDTAGEAFLLDLDKPRTLQHGEGLALEGGGVIQVVAADEPVADIHTHSVAEAARIAWHIGNRHIPVQVLKDGSLRIRDDHVLVEMIEGLGAHVHRHSAPFAPESGAYSVESTAHHHHDGHGHDH